MPTIDFITKLLGIKDENITFSGKITKEYKKNILYNVIHGNLSYVPDHCDKCGCVNENLSIIKYGNKTSDIKLLDCNGNPTIIRLKKQRFLCKHCGCTFSARTSLVRPNCYISRTVKLKIVDQLSMKVSEKDIANMNRVSPSTVGRIIDNNFEAHKPDRKYLPKHLLFDEFNSTKDAKGAMSFLYVNADTHNIEDILESRQKPFLKRYFERFSKEARYNVETVCMDMYSPYMVLVESLFPNAAIIIDRFHVVQHLNKAFTKTRINTMNTFATTTMEYKRLKRYWKLLLKDRNELDRVNFRKFTNFKEWQSEASVVDLTLEQNNMIKRNDNVLLQTYEVCQSLRFYIQYRSPRAFFAEVKKAMKKNISNEMKKALRTILKYRRYIENSMKYEYSNGPIEGINNYIKVLKRVAFGYRSFYHFRNRILISKNIIKLKTSHREAVAA